MEAARVPLLDAEAGNTAISLATTIGKATWLLTSCVQVGDMFGVGQLSLPQTFARLGYIVAAALLAGFCLLTLYSARLYQRLTIAVPGTTMFDQVAGQAMGRTGQALVWSTMYITIALAPIIFQITCAEALMQVFYMYELKPLPANVIVAALILPLAQLQHMEDVAMVSLIGTLGMVLSVLVVVGKLGFMVYEQQAAGEAPPPTHAVGSKNWNVALVGIMDILFCYSGQPNWWRYILSMKERSQFVRASSVSVTFMTAFYVLVAIVGYVALGDTVDMSQPLTSLLHQDMWTVVMNVGLLAHCVFAYQININVWAASFLELFAPAYIPVAHHDAPALTKDASITDTTSPVIENGHQATQNHTHANGTTVNGPQPANSTPLPNVGRSSQRFVWLSLTLCGITLSLVASMAFPFFPLICALISASGDFFSLIGLPSLFTLFLVPGLPAWEKPVCWAGVLVAVVGSILGLYSSIQQLVTANKG